MRENTLRLRKALNSGLPLPQWKDSDLDISQKEGTLLTYLQEHCPCGDAHHQSVYRIQAHSPEWGFCALTKRQGWESRRFQKHLYFQSALRHQTWSLFGSKVSQRCRLVLKVALTSTGTRRGRKHYVILQHCCSISGEHTLIWTMIPTARPSSLGLLSPPCPWARKPWHNSAAVGTRVWLLRLETEAPPLWALSLPHPDLQSVSTTPTTQGTGLPRWHCYHQGLVFHLCSWGERMWLTEAL